jgi:hypothetical protein
MNDLKISRVAVSEQLFLYVDLQCMKRVGPTTDCKNWAEKEAIQLIIKLDNGQFS